MVYPRRIFLYESVQVHGAADRLHLAEGRAGYAGGRGAPEDMVMSKHEKENFLLRFLLSI